MSEHDEELGRSFRSAWVSGVLKYFPGEPKPGYIAPWEQMGDWEKQAAISVCKRVLEFIKDGSCNVTAEQGGRYVSEAWNVEVFRNLENPKPSYVLNWAELPKWQQQTDIDIFKAIIALKDSK